MRGVALSQFDTFSLSHDGENPEKVQGANVVLPLAVVEKMSIRFENTLYGYFIRNRLAFPSVENYVKNAWAKYGLEHIMLKKGFFFFQFSTR
ncbi:hypothetical protein Tco_0749140 [Tanacetum coccineum]|uniref:Uncharacterized protein n=1 Tax=Tanacetum coccineum TaxID=301880 RepID=A0ABQ4YXJ6_9ASTR